jgi:hypothetical protein
VTTRGGLDTGPVVEPLLDGLLLDAVPSLSGDGAGPGDVALAVAAHREHRRAWYGDLLGPLRVPASAVEAFIYALRPGDDSIRIVLTAERDDRAPFDGPCAPSNHPLTQVRRARAQVLDNHRVELTGIELALADFLIGDEDGVPAPGAVRDATRRALDALDFTVPAWLTVEAVPSWVPAFDVLAEDAAESVALRLPKPAWAPEPGLTASVLHALSERDLPFAVVGGVEGLSTTANGFGLLNLLTAVRAETTGVATDEVATGLAEPSLERLASAARAVTPAEAAAVRDLLQSVSPDSVRDVVDALELEGLIAPDAA